MKQLINLGTGPNSGVGDTLYSGSVKINENFDELYSTVGNAVTLDHIHAGTGISVAITPGIATISNTSPHVQSDWNATSGPSEIMNKPVLSSIAFTGSYNDLLDTPNLPTLSTVAITGEYSDLLNIPVFPTLSTVAVSGEYSDLLNIPPAMADDRLIAGNFNAILDSNTGILDVPDGIRFTLAHSNNYIYGPGGNYTLRILGGNGDVYSNVGGHLELAAGWSLYGSEGTGGHITVTGGFGDTVGGDISITAGGGGGGYGFGDGTIHSTGGNVTITSGRGTGRGGDVIISSDTNSMFNEFTDVPGILNGDVVIETNRHTGSVWTFGADGTTRTNHSVEQSSAVSCPAGTATEVYSSWYYRPSPGLRAYTNSVKLFISCEGEVTGDASGAHVEASEFIIVRRPDTNTLVVSAFNRTHSSSAPLMTVTASVDTTLNVIKVYCRPTDSANPITIILNSFEHYTYVLSGAVIV